MKKQLKEYIGRSSGIGMTGKNKQYADTAYSRHMSLKKYPPTDYYDQNEEDEDLKEDDEDDIFENRIYRDGKYSLIETLEKINEKEDDKENEEEDEDSIEEFSTVAGSMGGHPVPPLGRESDGSITTSSKLKARQKKFDWK